MVGEISFLVLTVTMNIGCKIEQCYEITVFCSQFDRVKVYCRLSEILTQDCLHQQLPYLSFLKIKSTRNHEMLHVSYSVDPFRQQRCDVVIHLNLSI